MQSSIQHQEPVPPTEPTPATTSRLRTVTGNRFPRKCACGFPIPRDPEARYVVDFGAAKPHPAYLSKHFRECGSCRGQPRAVEDTSPVSGFFTRAGASTMPVGLSLSWRPQADSARDKA